MANLSFVTELGQLLREKRGEKTQKEFQKELEDRTGKKLGAKYVSLVETGFRKKLSADFLTAMEKVTGIAKSELIAKHQRRAEIIKQLPIPSSTLSIVTGHNIWSAALLGTVFSTSCPRDIRVATHATPRNNSPRRPIESDNVQWVAGAQSVTPDRNNVFFSGKDALAALNDGWADLAAFSTRLVQRHPASLQILARIVVTASPCVLLCHPDLFQEIKSKVHYYSEKIGKEFKKESVGGTERSAIPTEASGIDKRNEIPETPRRAWMEINTVDLGDYIRDSESSIKIGAEWDTVATDVIFLACGNRDETKFPPIITGDFSDWISHLLGGLSNHGKKKKELSLHGVLTWEPFATWALEQLPNDYKAVRIRNRAKETYTHPNRFEFALVALKRRAKEIASRSAFRDLLLGVADKSSVLSAANPAEYGELLKSLDNYFGLSVSSAPFPVRVLEIVGPAGFDVSIPAESLHLFS